MLSGRIGWLVSVVFVLLMLLPQLIVYGSLSHVRQEVSVVLPQASDVPAESVDVHHGGISARLGRVQSRLLITTVLAAAGMVLVGWGVRFGSRRSLYRLMVALDKVAGEIDSNSYGVKTTGTLLSNDTRRQSDAVVQTARTHKQIASLSRKNAGHAGAGEEQIRAYADEIDAANGALQELTDSMAEIKQAGEGIQRIVGDIDEIAANTNLLAINAGVEAVRAGAAGRAFGVIAGEVRTLALRCSQSAQQTGALIESTVEKVGQGVVTVGRLEAAFRNVVGRVVDIQKNMAAISDAARHQSEQLHGLDETLGVLETLTGRNVENSRRADVISGELRKNGEALRVLLNDMILTNISRKRIDGDVLARMLKDIETLVFQFRSMGMQSLAHGRLLGRWKAARSRQVAAVYTCRSNGTFVYSDPPAGIEDARIRPWWQHAAAGKPYLSPVYISAINRRACCTISVPIFGGDGTVTGVLGVDLKL